METSADRQGSLLSRGRVSWLDPLTGETRALGKIELRPWHGFEAPGKGQPALLAIEDARPADD